MAKTKKVKALFSRVLPYHVVSFEDADDSIGFDAYPVEVDARTLELATRLRTLGKTMDDKFDNMPAPEEGAQEEATFFETELYTIVGVSNGD